MAKVNINFGTSGWRGIISDDFTFNNEWFLQTWGTAMGKKFVPNYSNIFLGKWEKYALRKC